MKSRSEFICQQCGYKSSSYLGKCPECGSWNSLVETEVSTETPKSKLQFPNIENSLVKLAEVKKEHSLRMSTGFSEFDRVLGGGIVPGSLVLISGDPGIGKSTLLLQAAMRIAEGKEGREGSEGKDGGKIKPSKSSKPSESSKSTRPSVLYVTGEESAQQVKIRADRVGKIPLNLYILPQTQTEAIVSACEKLSPAILIVDSIQTLTSEKLT